MYNRNRDRKTITRQMASMEEKSVGLMVHFKRRLQSVLWFIKFYLGSWMTLRRSHILAFIYTIYTVMKWGPVYSLLLLFVAFSFSFILLSSETPNPPPYYLLPVTQLCLFLSQKQPLLSYPKSNCHCSSDSTLEETQNTVQAPFKLLNNSTSCLRTDTLQPQCKVTEFSPAHRLPPSTPHHVLIPWLLLPKCFCFKRASIRKSPHWGAGYTRTDQRASWATKLNDLYKSVSC